MKTYTDKEKEEVGEKIVFFEQFPLALVEKNGEKTELIWRGSGCAPHEAYNDYISWVKVKKLSSNYVRNPY